MKKKQYVIEVVIYIICITIGLVLFFSLSQGIAEHSGNTIDAPQNQTEN